MKSFVQYLNESHPDFVPKHIWDLHVKHKTAEHLAANPHLAPADSKGRPATTSTLKRNSTMTFKRLNKAVEKHEPDYSKGLDLMVRMNQESSRREEQ